jgi:hypothetical protein
VTVGKSRTKITDDAIAIIQGLEAAPSLWDVKGLVDALVPPGTHVSGRLIGATPEAVYLDHHRVPIRSVLVAATPPE